MQVLVLGSNGMLGSQLVSMFRAHNLDVYSTSRFGGLDNRDFAFEVLGSNLDQVLDAQRLAPHYIVNAIGVIKPRIDETNSQSVRLAVRVNAEFPHRVADFADRIGARVLQIATDCVYSGSRGGYLESSPHDALDTYGKTKSLGEVTSKTVMNLRSSIIGPEVDRSSSLWEWVCGQPLAQTIAGFTTHLWNGVTTHAFSEVCLGIIKKDLFAAGKTHLVPADTATKFELVKLIAERCGRLDLNIEAQAPHPAVDRTLRTENPAFNLHLWEGSSFGGIPTIREMIGLAPTS